MFEAVIFDCDGVLVDSEGLALEIDCGLLAEFGIAVDREWFAANFLGLPESARLAALERELPGLAGRARELQAIANQRYHAAIRSERLRAIEGVEAAVRAAPGRIAVASSSSASSLALKLDRTGLRQLFEPHLYSAEAVARGKPAPDLFLHAARALGVDPQRCLAIEDSANGVRAGRAAGMRVWGFAGGSHTNPANAAGLKTLGAERVVASWHEALAIFSGAA